MEKNKFIPLSVPYLHGNEWKYVKECLDTGWVSSVGAYVTRFEKASAAASGGKYAVAAVNGTAALHLALLVVGVREGDEVITSGLSFVATANAIRYCGAHPVFIDVDRESWNLDPEKLRQFLERHAVRRGGRLINKTSGRRIAAILPVHVLGHPAHMDPLLKLARAYRLPVVFDACEALGAKYKGHPIAARGDVTCLSFNGNKIATTGGGGMLVTNSKKMARLAKYYSTQAKDSPDEYIHNNIGYNYRLPNVLAAIGVAQLEKLNAFLKKKVVISARYREAFADCAALDSMPQAAWASANNWLFTVRVKRRDPRGLINYLKKHGIDSRRLWRPLYQLPMYRNAQTTKMEVANQLYRECVSLPCSVELTPQQQTRVIRHVLSWMKSA
jgi:perosamine synthetase